MKVLIRRLARLVLVIVVVTFFTFVLLDLTPGDPAERKAALYATPELVDQFREEMGLNDPLLTRYASWAADAVRGDFGESIRIKDFTSWELIRQALPRSLELIVLAELMAFAIAIPAAIAAARNPGGLLDRLSSASAFALLALPSFVLGIYLLFIFGVKLGWFPVVANDFPGFNDDPLGNLRVYFLPSITLALQLVAVYMRLLRTDLIDTLQQDYVMLAQARGLSERRIMWRHVLRPSSLNTLTAAGLNVGGLIGGAFIIEILFSFSGMGGLLVQSAVDSDYFVVAAIVALLSVAYVTINFVVDTLYTVLDPRIRELDG